MKKLTLTLFIALTCGFGFAQNRQEIDSLKHELAIAKHDTSRILLMSTLGGIYRLSKPDTALKYAQQSLTLAKQIKFLKGQARALNYLGFTYRELGDLPKALDSFLKALKIAEDNQFTSLIGGCNNGFGTIYFDLREYPKAINYYRISKKIFESTNEQGSIVRQTRNIGSGYLYNNQLDSAIYYTQLAYEGSIRLKDDDPTVLRNLGTIQSKLGNNQLALDYIKQSVQATKKNNDLRNASLAYNQIAEVFLKMNQVDSCIFYAKKGLENGQMGPFNIRILESSTLLSEAYKNKNEFIQAYKYQDLMVKTKEKLYGSGNIQAMQKMIADDEARRKEIENAKLEYNNQLRQYALLAGLAILLLVAFFLYRNNQKEKKAKNLLQEQKDKVDKTLSQLKSTQAQLIQSEKLASLGELTAGIAHEIQNPLNFVNNFSEVSGELVAEMEEEMKEGNTDIALEIASDLKQNLEKINHHGKRASSIVKGMLEHSRTSLGEKELIDINALADEYLRFAYHGLRAKDSSFNSDFKTDFVENLPRIEVIPQDIGRVLLNLINNAFYATKGVKNPLVEIKTASVENGIIVSVGDNGTGMSEDVKSKIFQPFFTTKPTGQGTGLGLSLAYNIVTKGHGGTLEVETKEGVGTTFIIILPLKLNQ